MLRDPNGGEDITQDTQGASRIDSTLLRVTLKTAIMLIRQHSVHLRRGGRPQFVRLTVKILRFWVVKGKCQSPNAKPWGFQLLLAELQCPNEAELEHMGREPWND